MILKLWTRNGEEILFDDVMFLKFTGDTLEITYMKTEKVEGNFLVGTHTAKFPINLVSLFTIEEMIDEMQ